MRRDARVAWLVALVGATVLAAACAGGAEATATAPELGAAFWDHWGDGRAELSGYDLTYDRYGEPRQGTAVTIVVTETLSRAARVKVEDWTDAADTFPALKLNRIEDFSTGIYDYNLMTTAFVTLDDTGGLAPGRATKVVFTSQEWCGQTFARLLFDPRSVDLASHSYFEGEAETERTLAHPPGGVAEDALLLWARGLAAPRVAPGESVQVPLLPSLERARLGHREIAWGEVLLARPPGTETIEVPAGSFEVEVRTATVAPVEVRRTHPPGGAPFQPPPRTWTFWVEREAPHRIVRWSDGDGVAAALLGSARLPYWELTAPGLEERLAELGLRPRPARTP